MLSRPTQAFVSVQFRLFQFTSVHFNSLCSTWEAAGSGQAVGRPAPIYPPAGSLLLHQQLHLQAEGKRCSRSVSVGMEGNDKSRRRRPPPRPSGQSYLPFIPYSIPSSSMTSLFLSSSSFFFFSLFYPFFFFFLFFFSSSCC